MELCIVVISLYIRHGFFFMVWDAVAIISLYAYDVMDEIMDAFYFYMLYMVYMMDGCIYFMCSMICSLYDRCSYVHDYAFTFYMMLVVYELYWWWDAMHNGSIDDVMLMKWIMRWMIMLFLLMMLWCLWAMQCITMITNMWWFMPDHEMDDMNLYDHVLWMMRWFYWLCYAHAMQWW